MMNFGFQMSIFFRKILHDFPKFFDKIFNRKPKKYRQTKLKKKCQK